MVRQTNDCPLNVHNAMMIVNVIIVIGTDGTNGTNIISATNTSVTLWYGKEYGGYNCTFIVEYTKLS